MSQAPSVVLEVPTIGITDLQSGNIFEDRNGNRYRLLDFTIGFTVDLDQNRTGDITGAARLEKLKPYGHSGTGEFLTVPIDGVGVLRRMVEIYPYVRSVH